MLNGYLDLEEKRVLLRKVCRKYNFSVVPIKNKKIFDKENSWSVVGILIHDKTQEIVKVGISSVYVDLVNKWVLLKAGEDVGSEINRDNFVKDLNNMLKDEDMAMIIK